MHATKNTIFKTFLKTFYASKTYGMILNQIWHFQEGNAFMRLDLDFFIIKTQHLDSSPYCMTTFTKLDAKRSTSCSKNSLKGVADVFFIPSQQEKRYWYTTSHPC